MSLQAALNELESAEEFLEFFSIPYDPHVVRVNRLHILQRLHNYLAGATLPQDERTEWETYRELLAQAYGDFVASDARTEKVFKVFRQNEPQTAYIPLSSLRRREGA